jgi:hypothetical protein
MTIGIIGSMQHFIRLKYTPVFIHVQIISDIDTGH